MWYDIMRFLRGPAFYAALVFFLAGMAYRLVRVISLGWSRERARSHGSRLGGVVLAYLKGLLILPLVPWMRWTFRPNALTYVGGGLFHLALYAVIFFGTPHMLVWRSLLGFGWWTLPSPWVDALAAIGVIALLVLLLNRLTNPALRLLSTTPVWVNWAAVFLPFVSGWLLTHHFILRYEAMFSLHMLFVDLLLVWIPLGRISHFVFYFFSRTAQGLQAGRRGVTP